MGTKWVLKNKKDERGIVIGNKARLVAQGHSQEEGINYEDVFAPVTKNEVIRLFLAYASYMGFTVYQMDVKSAFLYGTIDEEVYVMHPPGFQDLEFPHRVYKVEKVTYGLHQAPRAWYGTLSKYLLDNGLQRELLIDDSILSHESSDSNFEDNSSIPRPPPEPSDTETDAGEEIPVVMINKDKYDENDVLSYFMFVIFAKEFSLFFAESEDAIFDPDLLTKAFDVGRFQYLVGGDSGNSTNGLNRDPVVNIAMDS
nr:putative ribonuclease H-like domain-containing protein [Tanacetum cinerariifolium]